MSEFKPAKMTGVTVTDGAGMNWTVDIHGFYLEADGDYSFYPSTMGMIGTVQPEQQQQAASQADPMTMESLGAMKAEMDKLQKKVKKLKKKLTTTETRNQELQSLLFKKLGMEDGQSNGQQAVRRDADDAAGREQRPA